MSWESIGAMERGQAGIELGTKLGDALIKVWWLGGVGDSSSLKGAWNEPAALRAFGF